MGFPGGSVVNNSPLMQETGDTGSIPWVGKIPWRRKWKPTPGFLPGESHGRRSPGGYRPRGRRELDILSDTHALVDPDFGLQWLQTSQKGRPADTKGFMTEGRDTALKLPEN